MAWDSDSTWNQSSEKAGLYRPQAAHDSAEDRDHRVTSRAIWHPHLSKTWALPTNCLGTCCLPWGDQKPYIIFSPSMTVCPRENKNFIYVYVSCSAVFDSLQPHGLQPTTLLCPWNSQARKLEWIAKPSSRGIFLNPGFLHCRQILYRLSHQGSPKKQSMVLTNHSNQLALKYLTNP